MTEEKMSTREGFFAELLLSFIMGLTAISCLMIIRGFNEYITVTTYTQLIPLILVAAHAYIRKKALKLLPCFLLHIASSVLFYLAAIFIPFTGYGVSASNKFYIGVIVLILTIVSFSYRLNPTIQPSNSNAIAFPLCIFPIFGFFYIIMSRTDLFEGLIFNSFLIALSFLVMRQVAVFDSKFYHSIRNSSRPASHLKMQNYKIAAALVGIFALSLLILRLIPIAMLTEIIVAGLQSLIRMLIPVLIAILDFIANLFKEVDPGDDPLQELENMENQLINEKWSRIIGAIIAVLILIGFILLIINTIRILIMNAPRFGKEKESVNNGNVIDMIEDIKPEKNAFVRRRKDFGKGYEKKIRKQFYEKSVRAMRKGLPVTNASTPGQISDILERNGDNDFPALKEEYEKVRYGKK